MEITLLRAGAGGPEKELLRGRYSGTGKRLPGFVVVFCLVLSVRPR